MDERLNQDRVCTMQASHTRRDNRQHITSHVDPCGTHVVTHWTITFISHAASDSCRNQDQISGCWGAWVSVLTCLVSHPSGACGLQLVRCHHWEKHRGSVPPTTSCPPLLSHLQVKASLGKWEAASLAGSPRGEMGSVRRGVRPAFTEAVGVSPRSGPVSGTPVCFSLFSLRLREEGGLIFGA